MHQQRAYVLEHRFILVPTNHVPSNREPSRPRATGYEYHRFGLYFCLSLLEINKQMRDVKIFLKMHQQRDYVLEHRFILVPTYHFPSNHT